MLLAGSGSQQERGWPGPGAQLVAGRMAFEGWVDPWQWLGHWISAAEGQLWGAHGQIRKCRQRQYWKRMTFSPRLESGPSISALRWTGGAV